MKISTKGRYGLRAMVDLALNSSVEHVSLKSIAERQNISENYLEQVFSTLRKAEIVRSIKGPQGGYMLAEDASRITAGRILRALEGDLSVISKEEDNNNIFEACIKISVWERINSSIDELVDSITLEDITDNYQKMLNSETYMYYI